MNKILSIIQTLSKKPDNLLTQFSTGESTLQYHLDQKPRGKLIYLKNRMNSNLNLQQFLKNREQINPSSNHSTLNGQDPLELKLKCVI